MKTMQTTPTLSIIIVTKNVERTFAKLLHTIEIQDYPKNKIEIIVVDGKSTDATLEIIKRSNLKIRIVQGKYPNDPEACKGEGLSLAKGEIVGLIDSDNYLPNALWLKKMIEPLVMDKELVGSYTWRFAYRRKDNILNRYFSLIGSADPVGLYLGKADKLSYISDDWIGFGKILENHKKYFIVEFDKNHFPTLGSNGFFARRKLLLQGKADPEHFFHIDVPYDILKYHHKRYAVIKDVIIHDTGVNIVSFVIKRAKYMRLHYQKRAADRRYFVFDPKRKEDILRLAIFILCSLTFVQPIFVSIKGYSRIPDKAWFIHPILCFTICVGYIIVMFLKIFKA